MGDFQLGLILIGGACLLAVLLYNWLQLRRSRRQSPILPAGHAEHAGEGRVEPAFGMQDEAQPSDTAAAHAASPFSAQDEGGDPEQILHASMSHPAAGALEPVIDPQIDCLVPVELFSPVASERLMPLAVKMRRAGNKPVHVEGLHWETGRWEPVRAGQRYTELQLGVQLANRNGALHHVEYAEFYQQAQQLAAALDAQADFPDAEETLNNAKELDEFAQQCDVQMGINLEAADAGMPPWSAALIQSMALEDGLVLSRDGSRFNWYAEAQGREPRLVFSLQFAGTNFLRDDLSRRAARRVSLVLDVPRTDPSTDPLRTMWSYAAHIAQKLSAQPVDDNGRPLDEATLQAIDAQLNKIFARLSASGIHAGSAAALRLFSD
ncbi:MAG: cell division protein FtsZ [Candidatus Protistobacter heckmanni]|nr:cell division protein FtsZ [Candidatus Protistobacter heckmanni]